MSKIRVALDAQILIWAVKKQATPNDSVKQTRAEQLMVSLDKENATIVVPAIAFSEILVRDFGADLVAFVALFTRRFPILYYDNMCALRHAELIRTMIGDEEKKKLELSDPTDLTPIFGPPIMREPAGLVGMVGRGPGKKPPQEFSTPPQLST